jgi:nitrogen-specific signal transduction histidine kinase
LPQTAAHTLLAWLQDRGESAHAGTLAALLDDHAALARAKEAAEAANEAKTRFLASVSHEIRSPLNAIYGYAQLLERGDGRDGVQAGKVIRRSAEHLSNLVEGLLDIAQVESGSLKLARDTIRFPAFLEQVVAMFEPQAAMKGLALRLDLPPTLPEYVRTDPKRLRQVLINLLSNAIKFTDHGEVALKVHYRNELATFEVADSGIGIAPADIVRILLPFERGGAAAERAGIGLGLAITQALVHIMGGELRIESVAGEGSRFIVRLMLSQPLSPPADLPGHEDAGFYLGRERRLLLIDDDPAHRAALRALLEPRGFAVLTAAGGEEGLALAASAQPDLVAARRVDARHQRLGDRCDLAPAPRPGPQDRDALGRACGLGAGTARRAGGGQLRHQAFRIRPPARRDQRGARAGMGADGSICRRGRAAAVRPGRPRAAARNATA